MPVSIAHKRCPIDNTENIFINGKYWGCRTRIYGGTVETGAIQNSWFVCFTPEILREKEDANERAIGVNVGDDEYVLTITQLYCLTNAVEVPF